MKWLRSAEMEYISLIVNEDAAHDCIQKLGDLGVIQFTDLNHELTPFQRRYVSYIKRCDEMERKLRYFETEMTKFEINSQLPGSIDAFLKGSSEMRYGSKNIAMKALDTLEHLLEEKENELISLNTMHEKLTHEYNENKELQQILSKLGEFFSINLFNDVNNNGNDKQRKFSISESSYSIMSGVKPLLSSNYETSSSNGGVQQLSAEEMSLRFRHITGVVPTDDRMKFERMIFRATRGNCYSRFAPIEDELIDPTSNKSIHKDAFVIFFQSDYIEKKLRKICDAFHARLYTLPPLDDQSALSQLIQTNSFELDQSNHILRRNRESCVVLCQELSEHIQAWKWTILQEKSTYYTLNFFKSDVSGMLRGEGWVIKSALENVKYQVTCSHINADDKSMPSLVDTLSKKSWPEIPPTFFETNKFTAAYQDFVDTYGIPRYQEINPAVFTAVTFPFLFGVMYGDIGHGTCIFLAGLYMVMTEKQLENGTMGEMMSQLYGGRYMILMMGAFGIYAGLIYNDFFALSLNLFGSKYSYDCIDDDSIKQCFATHKGPQNVYAFGLDPIWKTSTNELVFFNSFKMKFSVIIGIIQMTFGILLKGWNALFFKNIVDFLFDFLPQLVFCLSLFGYMVVLIFWKWTIRWHFGNQDPRSVEEAAKPQQQPPALINTLINIVLNPTEVEDKLYETQLETQQKLLMLALLSIPIMLFFKPMIESWRHSNKPKPIEHHALNDNINAENQLIGKDNDHDDDHSFGELMIHQGIETIEFVLGMVSNTASYLRLWALSLAHSELALVFWSKAMLTAINSGNPIKIFIGFALFASVTTGVLLMMDVLECFLHALRLHWVEFQNKFYKADGHKFDPFSFKNLFIKSTASI